MIINLPWRENQFTAFFKRQGKVEACKISSPPACALLFLIKCYRVLEDYCISALQPFSVMPTWGSLSVLFGLLL